MVSPLFRLRRRRWFQRLTIALDRPVATRRLGLPFPVTLRLAPNLSLLLAASRAEPAERRNFTRCIEERRPRVFWDVGANIGLYGFTFLSRRPDGRCLLIEPDAANAACLRRTIERNRLAGTQVLQLAVSDSVGTADFLPDPLSGATGQLVGEVAPFGERHHGFRVRPVRVATTTLDDLLATHPAPQVVKVDVEHAEYAVLTGARRLLREARPVLFLELSAPRVRSVALLQDAGYQLYDWRTGAPAPDGSHATWAIPAEQDRTSTTPA